MLQGHPNTTMCHAAVLREVAILKMLQGHPNAIMCHACFETRDHFALVLELCHGGELLRPELPWAKVSEAQAAAVLVQLCSFQVECHRRGIMHRCAPCPCPCDYGLRER